MAQTRPYLTATEVADRLAVTPETARDWARTGKFRDAIRTPGGRYLFPVEAIEAIERGETVAAA